MTSPFDGLPDIFIGTFGQAVTLVDGDGVFHETRGIYRNQSIDALGMTQPVAVLHVTTSDAAKVADGDAIQIGDAWFTARVEEPDGKGMVPIRLEHRDGL
ncbi:head-tail joining protein [Citreimonas sp.]|uniref:head-tail joining protein n=1 Tax=Citreimonas sp. TaxID=3036715 RepID=UPI004059D2E4